MTDEEAAIVARDLLLGAGYRAILSAGESDTVETSASGLTFFVITYPNSYQFRCGFGEVPPEVTSNLAAVNEFNCKNRFSKIYVEDSSVILECDLFLSLEEEDAQEKFKKAMQMWELSLSKFRDWLRSGAEKDTGAVDGDAQIGQ